MSKAHSLRSNCVRHRGLLRCGRGEQLEAVREAPCPALQHLLVTQSSGHISGAEGAERKEGRGRKGRGAMQREGKGRGELGEEKEEKEERERVGRVG